MLERHAGAAKPPPLAVVIDVEQAHLHCAAALLRARIWQPDTWPDLTGVARSAQIWKDHTALADPIDELEAGIQEYYATDLDW